MRLIFKGQALTVADGETVLGCLERHGFPRATSCRSGVCQSCMMKAVRGTLVYVMREYGVLK